MNLKYLGAFRLPHDVVTTVTPRPNAYPAEGKLKDGFNSGGTPFALDLHRHELIVGTKHNRLGRVKLVAPAMVTEARELPVAPWVDQQLVDISGNTWNLTSDDGRWDFKGQAGVLPWGSAFVLATGKTSYDANNTQRRGHLIAMWPPVNLETPEHGPWKTVGPATQQGLIAGYMCPIPLHWQQRLKGKALTGQGPQSIITRGSTGPAAWSFDPENLLHDDVVEATMLVGYPHGHQTLGKWGAAEPASEMYSSTTEVNGVAIVDESAMFVGKHGYGPQFYGIGLGNAADPRIGQPVTVGGDPKTVFGFDPTTSDKGSHAYPYRVQLWIYSLLEMAEVAAGRLEPWALVPKIATLPTAFIGKEYRVNGCAYDDVARILYVCMRSADGYGLEPGPVVLCFEAVLRDQQPTMLEEIYALREDLRTAEAQLTVLESQRMQLATDYQAEVAAHQATAKRLETVLGNVRRMVGGMDSLRNL